MSKQLQNTQIHRPRAVSATADRKDLLNASGVGLQLQKLEELLCKTIQPHCHNKELGRQARHQYRGIAERKLSRTEILDIITILLEVLDSPTVPPKLVSYLHSTIGLLYLTENQTKLAIQSFTKALWVETTMQSPDEVDVGLTLHRLAVCHARLGDSEGASSLFEKALNQYKESPLKNDHSYIRHAQQELEHVKEKMSRNRSTKHQRRHALCA
jgi:tetratricopeptide (TPR) repeat protein